MSAWPCSQTSRDYLLQSTPDGGFHIESAEPRSSSSRFYILLHVSYRTSCYLSFYTYFFIFIAIFD